MQTSFMRHTFERVAEVRPDQGPDGGFIEYNAHKEFDNPQGLHLHRYGCGPFCSFQIPGNHDYECVFALTVDGELVFVGEAENLSVRINDGYGSISPRHCYAGGQSVLCRVNSSILSNAKGRKAIELWACKAVDRREAESELIQGLKPAWNIQTD